MYRNGLWRGESNSAPSSSWTVQDRSNALVKLLEEGCVGDRSKETFKIKLAIANIPVCRHFFREATGFERRHFNQIYKSVYDDTARVEKRIGKRKDSVETSEIDTLSFLDTYFKSENGETGR